MKMVKVERLMDIKGISERITEIKRSLAASSMGGNLGKMLEDMGLINTQETEEGVRMSIEVYVDDGEGCEYCSKNVGNDDMVNGPHNYHMARIRYLGDIREWIIETYNVEIGIDHCPKCGGKLPEGGR